MNPPAALRRDGLDPSAASVVGTGLHKTYRSGGVRRRATAVFDDVWFSADARELVAIAGPSGVGKSTLLYCLAGLEPVDAGEVRIEGVDITHCRRATRAQLRRTHMGFVFQEYNLVDSLTARGNIELALRMAGDRAGRGNRRPVVDGVLEQVGMTGRADAYPAELSGGQQQRIAVARALAVRPPVVFADEPTGALDVHNSGIVLAGLRDLAASGSCVVVVTHDPRVADQADRVVTLGP